MKSFLILLLTLQLALCYPDEPRNCVEPDELVQCGAFSVFFPPLVPRELVPNATEYAQYVRKRKAVFLQDYSCTEATEAEWIGADLVMVQEGLIIDRTEFQDWKYNNTDFRRDLEEDYWRVEGITYEITARFLCGISDKAQRSIWYSLSKDYPYEITPYYTDGYEMKDWLGLYKAERCEYFGDAVRLQYWIDIYNWSDAKPKVALEETKKETRNSNQDEMNASAAEATLPGIVMPTFGFLALAAAL